MSMYTSEDKQLENSVIEMFHGGRNFHSYEFFGCHKEDGKVVFRVYAPNADKIFVVGSFNKWKTRDKMHEICDGIWEAKVSSAKVGDTYMYEIKPKKGKTLLKSDPYAMQCENTGDNASIVYFNESFDWNDKEWIEGRGKENPAEKPINIYEVHLGSWKKDDGKNLKSFRQLADELPIYVKENNHTHIQLLPIMEHENIGFWDYSCLGFFAVTRRFGTPEDFKYFVDKCHENNIGVILDWRPLSFSSNQAGMGEFDGSYVYEEEHEENEPASFTFNFKNNEVQSYIISNAYFWCEEFHVDGLKLEGLQGVLFLDYNKNSGDWQPDIPDVSKKNVPTIDFFKKLTTAIKKAYPDVLLFVENVGDLPLATKPVAGGGLGFDFKFNSEWFEDTMSYVTTEPNIRKSFYDKLTFSLHYAFSDNFVLSITHNQVSNGKMSLIENMPGKFDDSFANYRLLASYIIAHPGKKLRFMGCEFAQFKEWNQDKELDWEVLEYPKHIQTLEFIKMLNEQYLKNKPFFEIDSSSKGFRWIVADDKAQNILAFARIDKAGNEIICIFNFSNEEQLAYRLGVDEGTYSVKMNSDEEDYGGKGIKIDKTLTTVKTPSHGKACSLKVHLAPLSAYYLVKQKPKKKTK